jgi:GNAT superfamily N-acetyltransferase
MIRKATAADIPAIVEQSREFYMTTDDAKFVPFCAATVENLARVLMEDHIMLVDVSADCVQRGMIGAFIAPGMFNNSVTGAHEVVWYVAPEHQSLGVGRALLAAADEERKDRGCWKLEKATLATSPPIADKILRSAGFVPSYNSYMKVD